ncbi:TPA: hypothetical protein ACGO7V_002004 [Streptococcus suis]
MYTLKTLIKLLENSGKNPDKAVKHENKYERIISTNGIANGNLVAGLNLFLLNKNNIANKRGITEFVPKLTDPIFKITVGYQII